MTSRRLLLFAASILAASALNAQFHETIEVKLVEIDVVVTDGDGQRVHGLTADDFEIIEGRNRQKITNFAEYRNPTASVTSPSDAKPPDAQRPPQSLLILIDRLPRAAMIRAREFENLDKFVLDFMHDGEVRKGRANSSRTKWG